MPQPKTGKALDKQDLDNLREDFFWVHVKTMSFLPVPRQKWWIDGFQSGGGKCEALEQRRG
jgi:hypothetical protein